MTVEDERRARDRQRGRDYINSEAGEASAEALGALLEALEEERGANNDGERAEAQARYLEAKAVLDYEIEAPHVRRRRMAVEALDLPSGASVDPGDFERVLTDCFSTLETQAGRDKLRRLLSRYILDDEETFGPPAARLLVEKLSANSEGLLGAIDRVEGKSGVGKTTGKNVNTRTIVVMAAGYSAGVEYGLDGNIPSAFWKRAQRRHGRLVKKARAHGVRIKAAKAATIKDWCLRDGPQARKFRLARADGFDRRASPDPSRELDPEIFSGGDDLG
jgi:hypothetical protein